jgi:transposase
MAGKPAFMSQIKQLLQLHSHGKGSKLIAKTLGISRNTVKAYLQKLKLLNLDPVSLLDMDDPVLEAKFHPGNPAYKDDRFDQLKEELEYFSRELPKVGVNKKLLWEEYRENHPGGYEYTQFCHHLNQQLIARKPSMVLVHKPGEKLFIDFAGKKLSIIDMQTGEIISCPVFVACLPYSDYSFVMAVKSQSVDDFIWALRCCLEAFRGVPKMLVPDNLKAAVIKANRYEPDINRVMDDFANHYQAVVIPTRVIKPKDKALVENLVKLTYTRVYAKLRNCQFFDLQSLNEAIKVKVKAHNQTRMQMKPYCREEKFLADELPHLDPLPEEAFEIKYYKEYTVGKNNYILLHQDKHYYSAPYHLIGTVVKVIYTRSMVYLYSSGERVATHPRDYRTGEYSTIDDHLCSHHKHYLDRSPGYYIQKAGERSPVLHRLVQLMFTGPKYPEVYYRSCDGLLRLHQKTPRQIFDEACERAIICEKYTYRYVDSLLKSKFFLASVDIVKNNPLPIHENLRGKDYYK